MEYNPNPNMRPGIRPVFCWGHEKLPKQKDIAIFTLSPNQQRPLAGALRNAVFNTTRRIYSQIFYVAPPLVAAYLLLDWSEKRNKYLNSKEGRLASEGLAI